MEKRNKIIISLILIIIIIPVSYFTISTYLHDLEEKTFYESIKKISDIENKSDISGAKMLNKTNPSNEEYHNFCVEAINTTSTEIALLQDLKTKVSNESFIKFIDIQINRLNSENRTYTAMLDNSNIYEQYKNGQMEASRALSLIEDKTTEIESYSDKTGEYKVEADSFLSINTDMKKKFNELSIDEDFLYDQIEEVKTETLT